jgi:hypothetical protein
VHAHQPVAPVPVDPQRQRLADFRQGLAGSRDMDDLVLGLAGDGCRDGDARPVRPFEMPGVAGLAAGCGVEYGAVEQDAAAIVDADDRAAASFR